MTSAMSKAGRAFPGRRRRPASRRRRVLSSLSRLVLCIAARRTEVACDWKDEVLGGHRSDNLAAATARAYVVSVQERFPMLIQKIL